MADGPGDVRVATRYDGIRARTSEQQLTAVDLHLDETAAAAVELLLGLLPGQDTPASADVALPVLVPRASSATGHPRQSRGRPATTTARIWSRPISRTSSHSRSHDGAISGTSRSTRR